MAQARHPGPCRHGGTERPAQRRRPVLIGARHAMRPLLAAARLCGDVLSPDGVCAGFSRSERERAGEDRGEGARSPRHVVMPRLRVGARLAASQAQEDVRHDASEQERGGLVAPSRPVLVRRVAMPALHMHPIFVASLAPRARRGVRTRAVCRASDGGPAACWGTGTPAATAEGVHLGGLQRSAAPQTT